MLFLNKSAYNFIFQIIRNFTVEYDYEMKYKYALLRTPALPLKFRMIDRVGWKSPINFSALNMIEFEYIMWFDRFTCNPRITNFIFKCTKFSELNLLKNKNHGKYIYTTIYGNNWWRLLKNERNMLEIFFIICNVNMDGYQLTCRAEYTAVSTLWYLRIWQWT
jgi:hypothetical protein